MTVQEILRQYPLPEKPSTPVRLGIVGCGGIARNAHFPALETLMAQGWPLSVTALCDIKEDNLTRSRAVFPAAKLHRDAEALLRSDEVDAWLFCLFPEVVEKLMPLVFERGLPLLVEKPVSHDPARLGAFVEEAAKRKAVVQVAFNRRFAPGVAEAKALLSKEAVHGASIRFWRRDRVAANFYHDTMVHAVNLAQHFLGPLSLEQAESGARHGGSPLPPFVHARLRSGAGIPIQLDVRPAIGQDTETYDFFSQARTIHWAFAAIGGSLGGARFSVHEGGKEAVHFQCDTSQVKDSTQEMSLLRGFTHQMAHFICGMRKADFNPVSSLSTAAETARISDAIRRMAGAE